MVSGTGKSFIGALGAKLLHDQAQKRILVVCYTNHALDQFLEDLMDIGIPSSSIVRIGGKSSARTESLYLQTLIRQNGRPVRSQMERRNDAQSYDRRDNLATDVHKSYEHYTEFRGTVQDMLIHLAFDHPDYSEAFEVPTKGPDDMDIVGPKGRSFRPDYLLSQWSIGKDAGFFKKEPHIIKAASIWGMKLDARRVKLKEWEYEMRKDIIDLFISSAQSYNDSMDSIERMRSESDIEFLRSKHIIGCTTTGAAKYRHIIDQAQPDVLLVEEAGEILESHVLSALGSTITQLILIGDHQ